MHLAHLPQALLLFLSLTQTTLARPEPLADQIPLGPNQHQATLDPYSDKARQQRLEAWKVQKPMHTTALLAGAAATAVSESRLRNGRRRDWSCITGEQGIWMPANFLDDDDDDLNKGRSSGSQGVRAEKALEWDEEVLLADGDVETHRTVYGLSVYGMKDVLARVWRKLEKTNFGVPRTTKPTEKAGKLDDGHDGDL